MKRRTIALLFWTNVLAKRKATDVLLHECFKRMADVRSLPSERYAFDHLGLTENDKIEGEEQLIRDWSQQCSIPEGVFFHPIEKKIISVEVKRIIGNALPQDNNCAHRKIVRRDRIIWPWLSSCVNAFNKANECIVQNFGIQEHHVVFIVPNMVPSRSYRRILRHIGDAADAFFSNNDSTIKRNRMRVHVIRGPEHLFDRF